jgi:hypothetical protein
MDARSDKTAARPDLTFASFARIDARELPRRSFARTVMKSEPIDEKCMAITMTDVRIGGTCEETCAISATTGAMLAGTSLLTQRQ